ncbi:MAG: Lrp/AsnC ligand binding domain-containing protein, partial [Bacteroidia bacterium]|nr:Lrp/AsnC ligand binding domain-containing protein [Bacteroidia bacterium]
MKTRYEIDETDLRIIKRLMHDASLPYTEVAKELGVSGGTIHVRMKKLLDSGVVLGSQLVVNAPSLGFDICAFIGIFLEKGAMYNDAKLALAEIPEIVELHYTTGGYSMFAKLICRDTEHLRQVLNDKIQVIPGITRTETFISLEVSIQRQIELEIDNETI